MSNVEDHEENPEQRLIPFAPDTSDDDLYTIAKDIFDGKIFTDRHLGPNNAHMFQSVFMITVFMDQADIEDLKSQDIGMFYEYYAKAGPMAVNALPIFFSCSILHSADAERVWKMYEKMVQSQEDIKAMVLNREESPYDEGK